MRFVLVDAIVRLEPGRSVHAQRTWPAELEIFADHFPGMPVVPGVLLTESMGQAAASCVEAAEPSRGKAMLVQIRSAVFRRWVRPGELVDIRADVKALGGSYATVTCRSETGGSVAAEAELMFSFVPWDAVAQRHGKEALERNGNERGA
jgi:3-hydroxyacyl-[acyl-carrier-protein] dehydratase